VLFPEARCENGTICNIDNYLNRLHSSRMTTRSEQAFPIRLLIRLISKEFLTTSLIFIILISVVTFAIAVQSAFAITTTTGDNKTSRGTFANMTFLGNMMPRKNMTMPGGNMTFGSSLQNAKMHLTEAIMDLKGGNTKSAAMEMNQTTQSLRLHEQELKVMMMQVKNMMTNMTVAGSGNSNNVTFKNVTS
jgi:hypothetical protein